MLASAAAGFAVYSVRAEPIPGIDRLTDGRTDGQNRPAADMKYSIAPRLGRAKRTITAFERELEIYRLDIIDDGNEEVETN